MRWGKKKVLPEGYSTRERFGFLWIPRFAGDEWRWLEDAKWVEYFKPHEDGLSGCWVTDHWLPLPRPTKGPSA